MDEADATTATTATTEAAAEAEDTRGAVKNGMRLNFSVARMMKRLKQTEARISPGAAVAFTAAIEAVMAKVLDSSIELVGPKRKRVQPCHIMAAVRRDPLLSRIFTTTAFQAANKRRSTRSIAKRVKLPLKAPVI